MSYKDVGARVRQWTPEQALSLLERAVEEKGADYRDPRSTEEYGTCRYFDPTTGQPECIVGHALSYEGMSIADFWNTDSDDDSKYLDQGFGAGQFAGYATVVGSVLRAAQMEQDKGFTWGRALEAARAALVNQ